MDASLSRADKSAVVSAVCRDDASKFVATSAVVCKDITDPTILEAYVCNEGMNLAKDCYVSRLCLASDCLEVIKNLKDVSRCSYMTVLEEITAKAGNFQSCSFRHESRDANLDAHNLAKHACTLAVG